MEKNTMILASVLIVIIVIATAYGVYNYSTSSSQTPTPTPTASPTPSPTPTPTTSSSPTPTPTTSPTPTASPTPSPTPTLEPVVESDFTAFLGNQISDSEIDGDIGSEWDDAGTYAGVAIDPQGTAEVWTKHDGTYLYMAVRFTADSDNPWVSLGFGGTTCMAADTDGALFGHDSYAANGYQDIFFNGMTNVTVDDSQDGTGAMTVDASNVVTVELKKPLSSGDSDGKDVEWTEGNTYALIITWNSNGYGSSGGSVSHTGGSVTARTILINSNVI